jgi:hypothetical protein
VGNFPVRVVTQALSHPRHDLTHHTLPQLSALFPRNEQQGLPQPRFHQLTCARSWSGILIPNSTKTKFLYRMYWHSKQSNGMNVLFQSHFNMLLSPYRFAAMSVVQCEVWGSHGGCHGDDLWNVAPCGVVEIDRRFRGAYCRYRYRRDE